MSSALHAFELSGKISIVDSRLRYEALPRRY
jgi:hypothetical protein